MVKKIQIGVIGIQGAITEHINSVNRVLKETNTPGQVYIIKEKKQLKNVNGLILPGGESTTISKILFKSRLNEAISKKIEENSLPIMGTCAGCVILSKNLIDDTKGLNLLSVMDMAVRRNAFGRQKESFEHKIEIEDFTKPYNAVFIRAPVIEKVWGTCKILAKIDKKIVMARQDNLLALSFHPELTDDLRIHKYFLDML